MSIRDLFLSKNNKLLSKSPESLRNDAESIDNIAATTENRQRFIPKVDFSNPENFANFGSAESYYEDAITRIYENYPYDGSSKEKQEFLNESTYIDLWMLDNKYPRTNGYISISATGWGAVTTSPSVATSYYGEPADKEYIYFYGGPHKAPDTTNDGFIQESFNKSNIYDTNIYDDVGYTGKGTRESNLKTNFDNGVTIEFWLKKDTFDASNTGKEVIFDLWNNTTSSADSYGRILLQLTGTVDSNFILTVQSGTSTPPYEEVAFGGSEVTQATLQTFGHYAFRIYNDRNIGPPQLKADFYKNGQLLESRSVAPALNEITGALRANIGALTSPAVISSTEYADLGWGKLSGSLDEFRFWKTKRTSEDIGRYWFSQVYGGSNTDLANTDLGVYYKFNEGITGNTSQDSTVLDYSGRITNGTWLGYGASSRNTGSAMVISKATTSEFKDPIIYSDHPLVVQTLAEMKSSGSAHDQLNNSSLYNGFPLWVLEGDNDQDGDLKKLTQIMSSYLDTLQLQIQELPKIQNISYYSGSYSKEYPFMAELLEGRGMVAPDIFADASVLEQIFSRSETELYSNNLTEIKNLIYRNIYNNLVYIFKSKGTEKSFRNLIRCYGIDDSLVDLNLYANNLTYELENTYEFDSEKRRYLDFYKPGAFGATVYQQTSSAISNSVSYISASNANLEKYTSFTLESDIILPKKKKESERNYFATGFFTSSVFGFHTADLSDTEDFAWPTNDYDLSAYIVRPPTNGNEVDAYFMLTSSYFGLNLTSPLFKEAYDNNRWNISARFYPEKISNNISGSQNTSYIINFTGYQKDLDVLVNSFSLTASVPSSEFLTKPKRIYAGAHRQDFSGSLLKNTDIKLGSVRYWMSQLTEGEISSHANDPTNYGTTAPLQSAYIYASSLDNVDIPKQKTLALDWGWDIVSSSSVSGKYPLLDKSSGSSTDLGRYGWLSNVTERQHTGLGDYNESSKRVVNVEYVPVARIKDPESLNSTLTTIKILNEFETEVFDRNTRPTNFYYMLEKSMYSVISKEMLRYFATITNFNNLIGEPVNRYRSEYKDMSKLRQLFYENIENEPKVEKYIEYYRWIDSSLSTMLQQLVPASSNVSDGIRNIIESHVLERNKYRNKLATLGNIDTDISGGIYGVNRSEYDWKTGTPTLPESPPPTNQHCYWWKYRADRTNPRITSGDAAVDASRNAVLAAAQSQINRKYFSPVKVVMKKDDIYNSGMNASNNNLTDYVKSSLKFDSNDGLIFEASKIKGFIDCVDIIDPMEKKKWSYEARNQNISGDYAANEGDLVAPFVAISSSVATGYNKEVNSSFKQGFSLENMHIDSYSNGETPLQGPFTEKYVGGKQSRHIGLNTGNDTSLNRPEAWKLEFTSPNPAIKIVHQPVNLPRASMYRGLTAKMPLNITNIKSNPTTGDVGNYSQDYEIVQTVGRTTNNVAYTKAGGWTLVDVPSPYVAGMDDYAKPQRGKTEHVFVNRFSSPGSPDTAGDSNGGPALDTFAAEYSPYNNINYRNTSIRWIHNLLLSSHVNQFGFYSDNFNLGFGPSQVNSLNYAGTGSIYQTNRNPIRQIKYSGESTITSSVYDNFYVQHPIPRSDRQYSWITASMESYDTFGYLPYSGKVSSSAGEISLVTFSSASDFISRTFPSLQPAFGVDKSTTSLVMLPTVYNGLNYNIYEPSNRDSGYLGYETKNDILVDIDTYQNTSLIPQQIGLGEAALLNAILLKRGGLYQHPTWKQIRNQDNPVVLNRRNNGLTAYSLFRKNSLGKDEFSQTKVLKDPAVIGKFQPLQYGLRVTNNSKDGKRVDIETVILESSYGNEFGRFANNEITLDIVGDKFNNKGTSYEAIYDLYADGKIRESSSPISGLEYITYSEQIYPSSINCYSKVNRERVGFKNTFWKNLRKDRQTLGQDKFGGKNSQGFSRNQSCWSTDAPQEFGKSLGISSYVAYNYSVSGAAGELQNDYTFYWQRTVGDSSADPSLLRPSPILSRKHGMNSYYSTVTPTGMEFLVGASTSSTYLAAVEELVTTVSPYGLVLKRGGNAKFEAHTLAGYIQDGDFVSSSATPFYDKYEQYNLQMRLKNKDMSLVPEFKIGDHIAAYLENPTSLTSNKIKGLFSIFGVNQQTEQTVTYYDTTLQGAQYDLDIGDSAPSSSEGSDFYKIYSFSDFMQHFDIINSDHDSFGLSQNLTLSCKVLKKFIPYDGFYPAERTLDIATAFSRSYSTYITASSSGALAGASVSDPLKNRPVYETLISPGVLFNTIKSGIAVDYPVYTSSYDRVQYYSDEEPDVATSLYALGTGSRGTSGWDYRVGFETLLNPEKINNIPFVDMNVNYLSKLNITSSMNAPAENNGYKMMINNYLAEIPTFFLNGLSNVRSKKDTSFKFENNKTYAMRIKMYRTMNKSSASPEAYPIPQDYPMTGSGLHETITMYSRPTAFGPPVAGTNQTNSATAAASLNCDSTWGLNPSFTPPYYNGECWADIIYTNNQTGSVTLDEIFSKASVKFWRIDGSKKSWQNYTQRKITTQYPMSSSAAANNFAMQLSASMNIFNKTDDNQWVIQTKFETPILNFGDKTKRPLTYNNITLPSTGSTGNLPQIQQGYGGQTTTPIGMWHQFGLIPSEKEGIYFNVGDIDSEWLDHRAPQSDTTSLYNAGNVLSLASAVGFDLSDKKLGTLRDSKTVYEAIVAIPFRETRDCNKVFFELEKGSKPHSHLRSMMDKYVFPPQFDDSRNDKAKPLAMYVFEFSHTFDRDDLSHIWQNISPKTGTSFQTATASISHPLLQGELLSGLSGEIKWMVFKVKQRAKTNYYDNVIGSKITKQTDFGYNWPYDYFSMVEFAKINSTVQFGKASTKDIITSPTSSGNYVGKNILKDLADTSSRTQEEIRDIEMGEEKSVKSTKTLDKDRVTDRAFDHHDTDTRAFDHHDTDTRAFDHQDKE